MVIPFYTQNDFFHEAFGVGCRYQFLLLHFPFVLKIVIKTHSSSLVMVFLKNGSLSWFEWRLIVMNKRSSLFLSLKIWETQMPSLLTFLIFSDCGLDCVEVKCYISSTSQTIFLKASWSGSEEHPSQGSSLNDVSPERNFGNGFSDFVVSNNILPINSRNFLRTFSRVLMLYSHMLRLYTYTCRIHIDAIIKMSEDFCKKYTSHFIVRLSVRGSWRPNRTATYWPPSPSGHHRVGLVLLDCSTGGLAAQPIWNMFSSQHLLTNWSPNSIWGCQRPLLSGGGFLYHILSPTPLISNSLTSCLHRVI